MTSLGWIPPRFEVLSIDSKQIFTIWCGEVIASMADIILNQVWTFPCWSKFRNGKVGPDLLGVTQHQYANLELSWLGMLVVKSHSSLMI